MTCRSAYAATRAEWVTSTTVVPCSRADPTSRSMTRSPVKESSAPVGSSANSTSGRPTRPRANATRCAWPPDSSPDRRRSSPAMPSRSTAEQRAGCPRRGTRRRRLAAAGGDLPGFTARRVGAVAAQHERGSPSPAVVAHFPAQPRRRYCHPLRRPILRVRRPVPLAILLTVAEQRCAVDHEPSGRPAGR
ncbi:hypothetical protein FRAHR75_120004 [Frankia sp. Hr75.2]|nr:hypothetical protein FRAHR75_120004 [Frankia sp. Hr75.2]